MRIFTFSSSCRRGIRLSPFRVDIQIEWEILHHISETNSVSGSSEQ